MTIFYSAISAFPARSDGLWRVGRVTIRVKEKRLRDAYFAIICSRLMAKKKGGAVAVQVVLFVTASDRWTR